MRLNQASDFALRILMLLAGSHEPLTVEKIADRLRLPKSHVTKLVAKLSRAEYVVAQRGRTGGVVLGQHAKDISIGEVVRLIETDFAVVECMGPGRSTCTFAPRCRLKGAMAEASNSFLSVLEKYSLADLVEQKSASRSA